MSTHGTVTTHHGTDGHASTHPHPSPGTYVLIGAILAVITLVEVGIFYSEPFRAVLVPLFLLLSAAKFSLVVGFFMHLKFDSRLFTGFFVFGLLIAAATFIGIGAVISGHPPHLTGTG